MPSKMKYLEDNGKEVFIKESRENGTVYAFIYMFILYILSYWGYSW